MAVLFLVAACGPAAGIEEARHLIESGEYKAALDLLDAVTSSGEGERLEGVLLRARAEAGLGDCGPARDLLREPGLAERRVIETVFTCAMLGALSLETPTAVGPRLAACTYECLIDAAMSRFPARAHELSEYLVAVDAAKSRVGRDRRREAGIPDLGSCEHGMRSNQRSIAS